jgi:hypothetical protein
LSSIANFPADSPRLQPTCGVVVQERYLDIMCRGAEAAGMAPEHLAALRATPCVPRKHPSEFQKFVPGPEGCDRAFKPEELLGHPEHKNYVVFNDKVLFCDTSDPETWVLRSILPPTPETTPAKGGDDFETMLRRTGANGLEHLRDGWDVTRHIAMQFHEPRYCELGVHSMEDVSEEHMAWLEDFTASFLFKSWRHVGHLVR